MASSDSPGYCYPVVKAVAGQKGPTNQKRLTGFEEREREDYLNIYNGNDEFTYKACVYRSTYVCIYTYEYMFLYT